MPLFSKRKSGKQSSKVSKHVSGKDSTKVLANNSPKLKEHKIIDQQHFNGGFRTPETARKDSLYGNVQCSSNSTAKCVANFPRRSRLSKSLPEVLVDDSVLPLFMEFLQKHGAHNILNFWLAAETFRLSSRDKTLVCYKSRLKTKCDPPSPVQNIDCDVLNVQKVAKVMEPVPDSFNDNRLCSKGDEVNANLSSKRESLTQVNNPGNDPRSFNLTAEQCLKAKPFENSKLKKCDPRETGCFLEAATIEQDVNNDSVESGTMEHSEGASCFNLNTTSGIGEDVIETGSEACKGKIDVSTSQLNHSALEVTPSVERISVLQEGNSKNKECCRQSRIMMEDALSIYRHFISLDASQPLGVDETTRRNVESNICSENGEIDPDCFKVAQKFVFETLENRYFDDFLRSSYYQKHIMDILTSGKVFLADIMYNDNAMFYFMEFTEQEETSYLLAFWFTVDSFCQELQSKLDKEEYNVDEALADAMVLYDKYFSMQATHPFGVSDETRISIENKICREGGPLPDCFEEPMENVLTLLEEVYFPIFLESSVYFKYLNELFSSVVDVDCEQTSASADDCSSTTSVTETAKLIESLANDSDLHEDPDEIWQRPNIGLSIGRVNEYGIYEPGIEPQPGPPQKSGGTTFGQKMKKLVSGDSYKVKEEMAWRVAKMVLDDVKKQQKPAEPKN